MRNILHYFTVLLLLLSIAACKPYDASTSSLGEVISKDDVRVTITQSDPENPNILHFKLENTKCLAIFKCPEAEIDERGAEFETLVSLAGDYTLMVQAYNKAGVSEVVEVPFSVEKDMIIDISEYVQYLCGDGTKVWRIDGSVSGHIGCGPEDGTWNEWWSPGPGELSNDLYDDDLVFHISDNKLELKNYGASLMNESTHELFPDGNSDDSFVTTHYTPSDDAAWKFDVDIRKGEFWLTMIDAFPAYAVNPNAVKGGKYKVLEINDTHMHIVYLPGGIAWHYFLTSEDR